MSHNKELIITLASLHNQLLKRIDRHLSVHGISFSEFVTMYHLDGAPNKTMRRIDLAERIGMSASGVTRLLNPMEKIGLVHKELNPRDARVSLVKLSEAGEKLFNDALVSFEHSADSILTPLTAEQGIKLLELVKALL